MESTSSSQSYVEDTTLLTTTVSEPCILTFTPTHSLPLSSTFPDTGTCPEPESFSKYASKLGYPENLISRVLADLGPDAETDDLLSHLISLQDMLCPKDTVQRRRRDATHLPSYMLSQDSFYKGKEKMPYWVWVKRETISTDVTSNPPHLRNKTRSRSRSSSSAPRPTTFSANN